MKLWLKYAFTRTLATFLGPADRGEESHSDYLKRQYLEEKAAKEAAKHPVSSEQLESGVGADRQVAA